MLSSDDAKPPTGRHRHERESLSRRRKLRSGLVGGVPRSRARIGELRRVPSRRRAAADAHGRRLRRVARVLLRLVLLHRAAWAGGAGPDARSSVDRPYQVGPVPMGTRTTLTTPATSISATSHRFVVQTGAALAADPLALDLVRLMVETVHFGEHTCVVALGIDGNGVGHPFLLRDVSTDNIYLVTDQQPPRHLPASARVRARGPAHGRPARRTAQTTRAWP